MHCGSLIGKITPAQLYNVFVSLEAFVFLAVDKENVLKHPRPYKVCQHGVGQKECKGQGHQGQGQGQNQGLQGQDGEERPCNTVEDLKYRLVRFLIDSADVQVVERASVVRLQSGPLRLATCNLHGLQTKQGGDSIRNILA